MKTLIKLLAVALALFASTAAFADDAEINLKKPSFFGGKYKHALNGYDSTTYWGASGPQKGSKEFKFEYKGATWLFVSAENLEKFKAEPTKYAPEYGNYCAYALGNGSLAAGDPEVWEIVDGKLYLNYNEDVQVRWQEDQSNLITKADGFWPTILKK